MEHSWGWCEQKNAIFVHEQFVLLHHAQSCCSRRGEEDERGPGRARRRTKNNEAGFLIIKSNRSISSGGGGIGVALRKPEIKEKKPLLNPAYSHLGEEVAWGPWGLHGFSLTARTKEERKQIQLAVEREDMAAIKFVSKGATSAVCYPRRRAIRSVT